MNEPYPYPKPDFSDPDLMLKEIANGTFAIALRQAVKKFSPVFDRYSANEAKLKDDMLRTGKLGAQAVDLSLHDEGMGLVKQLAALPLTRNEEDDKPEVVYDPREFYSKMEYRPFTTSELSVPYVDGVYCYIPYYDDENPGLFGTQTIKDADGNVEYRNIVFCSLKDYSISILGRIPDDLEYNSMTGAGYVKGAFVAYFEPGSVVSFTLDSGVYRRDGVLSEVRNFGDSGCFAVTDGDSTFVLNTKMVEQDMLWLKEGEKPIIVKRLGGDYCTSSASSATGFTRYPFGVNIGKRFYFSKSETESYKWRKAKKGWKVLAISKPVWKYNKLVKYDYSTDNWMNEPGKLLGYNLIKHGVIVGPKYQVLKGNKESRIFISSCRYGDFVKVDGNGYHTYDFKVWNELPEDATEILYGTYGRIWTRGRGDGIAGIMPYTFSIISSKNSDGEKVMVERFRGFVFF